MAFGDLKGTLTGGDASIGTSAVLSGSVSVAVGDLIALSFAEQTALTTTAISDNLGNTYAGTAFLNAGLGGFLRYAIVTNAGTLTTITVTSNNSGNDWAAIAGVIEGPVTAQDKEPSAISSDVTSPLTCPSTGTLSSDLELVISWGCEASGTWAATSPNLLAGQQQTGVTALAVLGYQVVNSTNAVAPEFTVSPNPGACILGTISFFGVPTGNGALAAQASDVAGSGLSSSLGTGALAAQASDITGSGTVGASEVTGTGALNADAATVSGSGLSASLGTGTLAAQASDVTASGLSSSLGTGSLAAQEATVVGSGTVGGVGAVSGDGALGADDCIVIGVGFVGIIGTVEQTSVLNGTGAVGTLNGVAVAGGPNGTSSGQAVGMVEVSANIG